jgi:hypothetical protein
MQLTRRCREVVVGTILGDGCLERNGTNVRLRIDHGAVQRALVEWKFHELRELSPSSPRLVDRVDVRTGRNHSNYRFTTATVGALNRYFLLFYGEGAKFIPHCIHRLLRSPLSLAVWYMDDGGRRRDCRSGYLNTNAFSVHEVDVLRECLKSNYGIRTVTHFAAGKPRIYIPKAQFSAFCDLIRPHVIEEMTYKLL